MPNTISTQKLVDGPRTSVIKVTILGDGSGDETNTVIFDASAYSPAVTDNKLRRITFTTVGASAVLSWDATANVTIIGLPTDYSDELNFDSVGGLINNAGTGVTGDILITTTGLGSGELITLVLTVDKREIPVYT